MPSPSELLDAAGRARSEGRLDDFRVLMGEYARRTTPVPAALPTAQVPPPTLGEVRMESQAQAKEAVAEQMEPLKTVLSPASFEARARGEEAVLGAELERRRAGTPLAGGGVQPATGAALPFLRPTRIREGMYVEPSGVVRPPSPAEEFVESLAQQPVETERQTLIRATQEAIAGGALPQAEGEARLRALAQAPTGAFGPGVTEGSLSAGLRLLSAFPVLGAEAAASAVEAALPIAPAAVREYVEDVGVIPPPIALTPLGRLSAPIARAGLATPIPRAGSEAPLLSRAAQTLRQNKGFKDSFAENEKLVGYYQREYGVDAETARGIAGAQGLLVDLVAPVVPAGEVAAVGRAIPGVSRLIAAGDTAVGKAATKLSKYAEGKLPDSVIAVAGSGAPADRALARVVVDRTVETAVPEAARPAVREAMQTALRDAPDEALADPAGLAERLLEPLRRAEDLVPDEVDEAVEAARQSLLRGLPTTEPLRQVAAGVAVPRSIAPRVRREVAEQLSRYTPDTIQAEVARRLGPELGQVVPPAFAREFLRSALALEAGGAAARELRTVSAAQQAVEDVGGVLARAFPAAAESRALRRLALVRGLSPSAETARTERLVVEGARRLQTRVADEIRKSVQSGEGAAKAIERIFLSPDEVRESLLSPLISRLYGDAAERAPAIRTAFERADPTVRGLTRASVEAAKTGLVRPVSIDDMSRAIVATGMEEIGREVATRYGLVLARVDSGLSALRAGFPSGGLTRAIVSTEDRILAAGAKEAAKYADNLPVAQQVALAPMIADTLGAAAVRQARLARQAVRYGVIVPRTAFFANLTRSALLPLVTVGVGTTTRGAWAALRRISVGGPLYTPGGLLSAAEVDDLARMYGIGITAVDAERIGILAEGLYKRAVSGKVRNAAARTRDFWADTASAVERTVRRGIFEAALAAGDDAAAAARTARNSVVDYEALLRDPTTAWAADAALKLVPTAAEASATLVEIVGAAARNPRGLVASVRAASAAARAQDPEARTGDEGLRRLGIIPAARLPTWMLGQAAAEQAKTGLTFYGPENPLLAPIAGAVGTMAAARDTAWVAGRLVDAVRGGSIELPPEARERARQMAQDLAAAVTAPETVTVTPQARRQRAESVYAALVLAAAMDAAVDPFDPEAQGAWGALVGLLDPVPTTPEDPAGYPYWSDGQWKRFRPSEQGLANLEVLRSIPGADLLSAYPMLRAYGAAAWLEAGLARPTGTERVEGLRAARGGP